ncbi:MAG: YkgJ family cysteine cluster protein [Cyanobacteria bacterium RYN_339]|nr:YkgJ family cysteine cluster protein [Cyanobacteria bacterium RYN_339]
MADEDFEEVLGRFADAVRPAGQEAPAIASAIEEVREALPRATSLAEAFGLVDRLAEAVREAYPQGHCKAGCSGCCDSQTAIFDVSPVEWEAIAHALDGWEPERKAALAERFRREHGPRLKAYKGLSLIRYFEPVADRYFARRPYSCPLLENGRCSVYAVRPLACRMYGYFAIRARFYERPAVYGCGLQTSYYETRDHLALPAVNMVAAQTRRLTRGRARILPLWLTDRL